MKSFLRFPAVLLFVIALLLPLTAQDAPQIVALDSQFGIVLPEGWTLTPAGESDTVEAELFFAAHPELPASIAANGDVTLLLLTPVQAAALLEFAGESTDNPLMAITAVHETVYGTIIGGRAINAFAKESFAGFDTFVMKYTFPDIDRAGEFYVLTVDEQVPEWLIVHAYGPTGSLEPAAADISALLNSLVTIEPPDESASAEPCIVSTAVARSATVRVGPGEHRTALTFLKVDQNYTVEGRLVDDGGAVWYRLIKAEVDPGSSAAELWTAAEGLTAVGGCDTVGEAVAPPLRPIIQARPTTAPGGSNSGGTTTTTDPAEGLIIPASGTWLFVYNATALVSCQGTNTIEMPISELDWPPSEIVTIDSSPDGSFYVESSSHVRPLNDTAYLGDYNVDGSNIQAYLFPQSSTRVSGELRVNFVWNGWNCSGTIRLSGSLQ
ncbi:MAG: hypothetical protein IPK52_12550 [Chloroflexi bacterium]|nr:hypothetical protein [Chloroflexota bacterium]